MISKVIQDKLVAIISNTYLNTGDEEITAPYCVHKETDTSIIIKKGIVGYNWKCEIAVIDNTPEKVETSVNSIIAAMLSLKDTSTDSTTFISVVYEGGAPDYDEESALWVNVLQFSIETKNR